MAKQRFAEALAELVTHAVAEGLDDDEMRRIFEHVVGQEVVDIEVRK